MQGRCPDCRNYKTNNQDARYLSQQALKSIDGLKDVDTAHAQVYPFHCQRFPTCGKFWVILFFHKDDPTKSQKITIQSPLAWSLAQPTKPGQEPYTTTFCEWTEEVSGDTGNIYHSVLRRERKFAADNPPGTYIKEAQANRKRLRRLRHEVLRGV